MTTKFTLEIKLGNDLMHNGSDVATALREVSQDYRLTDADPLDRENDFVAERDPFGIIIDGNGAHVGVWRIAEQSTPDEIAQQVLASHAMDGHPDWMRSVEQIIPLLAEAVRITRGEV